MYTKSSLINDLHKMGLKSTDTIMVHSSMKAIGPVEGGADTVIDAFMEYFRDGLFMMPTHTWAQMGPEYSLFDPETEPACVGILPNIFRQREGVVRSLHPTHSIAAYGTRAASYIEGEENVTTPCQPGGCWSRLLDEEAKILMLGCTHIRNTFIHAVEELLDVPERLTEKPVDFQIKMPDGTIKEVAVHRHYNKMTDHISEEYDKLLEAYYECGAAKKVKFGDADCILCDAKKLYEVTKKVLSHEINCLIDRKEIPRTWWRNPFLSKTLHNSEYLTANCSLNKVRFAKLPLYGIEDDMEGKQMSELFGASIIADEIERNATALGIDLSKCQRAELPKILDQKIEEGNEEAIRIARKFGNRLGMFLLLLKTGLPENRAIREDWKDEHWEYWANVETIYLVGGIANGRMCEYMLMVVEELFEKANLPMYNIVRNIDSPEIGARGCLTQIENPDKVQLLFDFGQTMMKRMIAVRHSEDEEYELIKLPSKKSIDMTFFAGNEDENRRQAEELHRYIVDSIMETYEEAEQYGSIGWEIVISIASYVMDGKIYDARSGYAKLCTLSDNYAGFLAATLEIMLDRSIMVKLVHDGTAAALYYKGAENAVCITAGTAFGVGFPEINL